MEPVLQRLGDVTIQRLEKPKEPKVGQQRDSNTLEKEAEEEKSNPTDTTKEENVTLKRSLDDEAGTSNKKIKFDKLDLKPTSKARDDTSEHNFSENEMSDFESESDYESDLELERNKNQLSNNDNSNSEIDSSCTDFLEKLVQEPFVNEAKEKPIKTEIEDSEDYDYDIKEKLKEMGEISFETVKKGEKPKKVEVSTENEVSVMPAKKMSVSEEESLERKTGLAGNLRRNIREVMDEAQLDEATLAAQRQEMERLRRVQEQQRLIREVQRQVAQERMQHKVLSLLQGSSPKPGTSGARIGSTVLVKLPNGQTKPMTRIAKRPFELVRVPKGVMAAPKNPRSLIPLKRPPGNLTPSVSIAPVGKRPPQMPRHPSDSDSENEDFLYRKPMAKPKSRDSTSTATIDISSDDDCIVISEGEGEGDPNEPDEDPGNSGMHTNDVFNQPDEQGRVVINVGHPEGEVDLYLASQIARIIKPHQIGGVRFLYDNVVESVERFNCSTGFGCILAHSMGLGKTLQVVCFSDIFLRHTNARTILCIMPINTLQNWLAEYNMWLPTEEAAASSPLQTHGEVRPRNFNLHVLNDSHKTLVARARVIHQWRTGGGVLLIGYEQFRLLSLRRHPRSRKKPNPVVPLEDDKNKALFDEVHEALVKPGPDLVICDEGHRIKNSHASISQALKQMRTKRRVVLTGYPLQNNLMEYWCMVDFVRPNYLGTKTEFCNMFERPIQNGQCIDSTETDIKLMRYRAHVLHSLLVGFVQRRSHAVLQTALPQKEEYVLLVRMTPFQRKLYETFMNEVVRTQSVPNPLKAFAVCCKIWNHPDVLYYFLKKRAGGEAVDIDLEEVSSSTGASSTSNNVNELTPSKPRRGSRRNTAKSKNVGKPAASITPYNTTPDAPPVPQVQSKPVQLFQSATATPPNFSQNSSFVIPSSTPSQNSTANFPTSMPAVPFGQQQNNACLPPPYPNNSHFPQNPPPYPNKTPQNITPSSTYPQPSSQQTVPNLNNFSGSSPYPQSQQGHAQSSPQNFKPFSGSDQNQMNYSNFPQNSWGPRDYNQQNEHFNNFRQMPFSQNSAFIGGPQNAWIKKEDDVKPIISSKIINGPIKTESSCSSENKPKINIISDIKIGNVFGALPESKKINIISDIKLEPKKEEKEFDDEKYMPRPDVKDFKHDIKMDRPIHANGDIKLAPEIPAKFNVKEDTGIPYDWAVELLKDYVPGCIENSGKMEILFCIIRESIALGDRLLLFSQSLITLDLIEQFLQMNIVPGDTQNWAKNTNYYRLDGSTSALEREKLINEFNSNPNIYLFLVSTRAGSLGINLVGANRVVVLDASWNPCHDTQAVCRVYRYGQRKPCFVYRLVMDNCLEKKIYDRQINKQGMSDRVVDECNPDAHLSMKDVSTLCWDDQEEVEEKDWAHVRDNYIDVVLQKVLIQYGKRLNKEPFQHESLLVDRKDKQLSQQEKRLAKKGYEREKQAARQPAYSVASSVRGHRPVASVRPMQQGLERPSRWIPAEHWQRQGMTAQEMTLPLDVVIPTNQPDKGSIVLKAGQKVLVLKSPKGVYMQLENGKIVAIKTAIKVRGKADDKESSKMVKQTLPPAIKNNSAISVLPQKRVVKPFSPGLAKLNMRSVRQAVPNLVSRIQSITRKVQMAKSKPYQIGAEIAKAVNQVKGGADSQGENADDRLSLSKRGVVIDDPALLYGRPDHEKMDRLSKSDMRGDEDDDDEAAVTSELIAQNPALKIFRRHNFSKQKHAKNSSSALEQLEQSTSAIISDSKQPFQDTLDSITSSYQEEENIRNSTESHSQSSNQSRSDEQLASDDIADVTDLDVSPLEDSQHYQQDSQSEMPPTPEVSEDIKPDIPPADYGYNNYYGYNHMQPYHPPPQGYGAYPPQPPPHYDYGYPQPQQPQYNYGMYPPQNYPPPPPPPQYPPQAPPYDYGPPPPQPPMYGAYPYPQQQYPPPPPQGMYPPTTPPYPDYQYNSVPPPPNPVPPAAPYYPGP